MSAYGYSALHLGSFVDLASPRACDVFTSGAGYYGWRVVREKLTTRVAYPYAERQQHTDHDVYRCTVCDKVPWPDGVRPKALLRVLSRLAVGKSVAVPAPLADPIAACARLRSELAPKRFKVRRGKTSAPRVLIERIC